MKHRPLIIAAIVAVVLQVSVVPYIALATIRPNLPILVVLFVASRRGSYDGVIYGFLTGLAVDSLSTGFLGLSSFTYSIAAFLVGKVFYWDVALPLGRWALASGVGLLIQTTLFSYVYTLGDAPAFGTVLASQALPTSLYTWFLGLLWAISPFYERRGGMRLES